MAKRAPLARARLPIRPLRADRGARGTHNDYGSRANCRAFLPADSVSSPCGLMAGWCGRVTIRETDCVADDAVREFPGNREINREFCRFGPFLAILAPNRQANSMDCSNNSLCTGTGNFLEDYRENRVFL